MLNQRQALKVVTFLTLLVSSHGIICSDGQPLPPPRLQPVVHDGLVSVISDRTLTAQEMKVYLVPFMQSLIPQSHIPVIIPSNHLLTKAEQDEALQHIQALLDQEPDEVKLPEHNNEK